MFTHLRHIYWDVARWKNTHKQVVLHIQSVKKQQLLFVTWTVNILGQFHLKVQGGGVRKFIEVIRFYHNLLWGLTLFSWLLEPFFLLALAIISYFLIWHMKYEFVCGVWAPTRAWLATRERSLQLATNTKAFNQVTINAIKKKTS